MNPPHFTWVLRQETTSDDSDHRLAREPAARPKVEFPPALSLSCRFRVRQGGRVFSQSPSAKVYPAANRARPASVFGPSWFMIWMWAAWFEMRGFNIGHRRTLIKACPCHTLPPLFMSPCPICTELACIALLQIGCRVISCGMYLVSGAFWSRGPERAVRCRNQPLVAPSQFSPPASEPPAGFGLESSRLMPFAARGDSTLVSLWAFSRRSEPTRCFSGGLAISAQIGAALSRDRSNLWRRSEKRANLVGGVTCS